MGNEKQVCIFSTKKLDNTQTSVLKSANIHVESSDFITIKQVESNTVSQQIQTFSPSAQYVIFTSKNAVEIVFGRNTVPAHWKLYCIAGATKAALLKYVDPVQIIGEGNDAEELSAKITADALTSTMLWFCGAKRLDILPTNLQQKGIKVEEIIVYDTLLTPLKIDTAYNAILFYSPSGVKSFFSVNTISEQTVLFSIGYTTTKALQAVTDNKIITADFPSVENLLQKVNTSFKD